MKKNEFFIQSKAPKILSFFLFFCCFFALYNSCSLDSYGPPPFCFSKPIIILDQEASYDSFCGLFFVLKNTADIPITKIIVKFSAYNNKTEKSITQDALNTISVALFLEPKENMDVFINLEEYMALLPDDYCIVDYFCIKEVLFSDGTVWKDSLDLYAYYEE